MSSIELIGPQGYEYQYLVTAYLALELIDDYADIELIVEKDGGEDAEIILTNGDEKLIIEVQVKSNKGELNLNELISWIQHFPSKESINNLLHRLDVNSNRLALFVTKARCNDDTRHFVTKNISKEHTAPPIKSGDVTHFIETLKNVATNFKSTNLGLARNEFCTKQADYYLNQKNRLRELCKKIIVHEQQLTENIEEKIFRLLNSKYRIPQSICSDISQKLMNAIRDARDQRIDVINTIKHIIESASSSRVFTGNINIEIPIFNELIQTFDKENILLLTGLPFCGKTHVAELIAQTYQDKGFHCKEVKTIEEAFRFLVDSSTEERLCIIEDPFGEVELDISAYQTFNSILNLINKTKQHRKIIITTRIDLLKNITEIDETSTYTMGNNHWFDLTMNSRDFLIKVWQAYSIDKNIPASIRELVRVGITKQEKNELLQPGQIRHLAHREHEELFNKSFDELCTIARQDSRDIGIFLSSKEKEFTNVVYVLGLHASTIIPINLTEIAYILSNDEESPSIRVKSESFTIEDDEDLEYPSYKEEYVTTSPIEETLEYLEARGFIIFENNSYKFSHPTYHEACRFSFNTRMRFKTESLLKILEKGHSCLNPVTALQAANQLNYLYKTKKNQQTRIIEIAMKSIHSIYPAVRDAVISFLITNFNELPEVNQHEIINYLRHNQIKNLNLNWFKNIPWLLEKKHGDLTDFRNLFDLEKLDSKIEEEILNIISSNKNASSIISSKNMWLLVKNYNNQHTTENNKILKTALSYNEAFIREKAAYYLMENSNEINEDLIELIFRDSHPTVIYQAVKGCFITWNNYSPDIRKLLIEHLTASFKSKALCAVASRFIIDFGDPYAYENITWNDYPEDHIFEIWDLWAELFPLYLDTIPEKMLRINESHMFNTLTKSMSYLSQEKCVYIINAWIKWVDRNLQFTTPDSFGLSVAEILLEATKNNAEIRMPISEYLLNHTDTCFITVSLNTYIHYWEYLNPHEKYIILELLDSERIDIRWLKAIALTRNNVPDVIIELLTGYKRTLHKLPHEVVTMINENLICDCIHVYCGHPQPLWWLGLHCNTHIFWRSLILELLNHPQHKGFPLALGYFLDKVTDSNFMGLDEVKVLDMWRKLCALNEQNINKLIFNELLTLTVQKGGTIFKDYWRVFFENCIFDIKEYIKLLNNYIEAISDRNENIFTLFEREIYTQLTFSLFDTSILKLYKLYRGMDETLLYNLLKKIFTESSPRLLITLNISREILNEIKNITFREELLSLFDETIDNFFKVANQKRNTIGTEYEISDWFFTNRNNK
ncbi:DUF4297 domain-containing protein [Bacillus toyonensis]|uniref:dsDNA nuclease domain-containing protein n=1 Tax=Bacillus toyonensis TaxID=155322 RepID=UPI00163A974E|nr:dsDNA nuclease domain-containing protein [Bacillus toyonensis]MBC2682759.1 DUF4297 domain-containing protein [Bacillus toyonensis]